MFIATETTALNIDNGIAKAQESGNHKNQDLMVMAMPPAGTDYEDAPRIYIKQKQLNSRGLTNNPWEFIVWCNKQLDQ